MSVIFSRVDDRYVHGQVMAVYVKSTGANRLIVISDKVAADSFQKMIFEMSGVTGAKVEVYTVAEAKAKQDAGYFDPYQCIFMFGSVKELKQAVDAGIKWPKVQVASIPAHEDAQQACYACYVTKQEGQWLREIAATGIEVYFQNQINQPVVSLEDGLKKIGA